MSPVKWGIISTAKIGTEKLINPTGLGFTDQSQPDVAFDANGNFVIVYHSNEAGANSYDVYGQRYFADGTENGSRFLVHTASGRDIFAAVAMAREVTR